MSIKDLFNNPGTPKIQKSVTSDELVQNVESSEYVEAKRKEFARFVPPIDFSDPSNFAKFGSAELYYEKAFERIHNYYPYDGTLHEKIQFQNSSSYLDKYVFDNLYPRTNGYLTFNGAQYISVFGGPHTASVGMEGKTFDSTFDLSMKYDEEKKRKRKEDKKKRKRGGMRGKKKKRGEEEKRVRRRKRKRQKSFGKEKRKEKKGKEQKRKEKKRKLKKSKN